MFSVPPATTTSASPHRIAWAASITLFSPEPQTLLTVVAPTETGSPTADGGLAGDVLSQPGPHHIAHNHLVNLVGGHASRRIDSLTAVLPKTGAGTSAKAAEEPADRRVAPPDSQISLVMEVPLS